MLEDTSGAVISSPQYELEPEEDSINSNVFANRTHRELDTNSSNSTTANMLIDGKVNLHASTSD